MLNKDLLTKYPTKVTPAKESIVASKRTIVETPPTLTDRQLPIPSYDIKSVDDLILFFNYNVFNVITPRILTPEEVKDDKKISPQLMAKYVYDFLTKDKGSKGVYQFEIFESDERVKMSREVMSSVFIWVGYKWLEIDTEAVKTLMIPTIKKAFPNSVINIDKVIKSLYDIFEDTKVMLRSILKPESFSGHTIMFRNGMLRIGLVGKDMSNTIKFHPVSDDDDFRHLMITNCVDYDYIDTEGEVELNKECLDYFKSILPDDDFEGWLKHFQVVVGYLLIPTQENDLSKAIYFYGPGGNGKSTFGNILSALLGKGNVTKINLNSLLDDKGRSRIDTIGKIINISNEMSSEGLSLEEFERFKMYVSGEDMLAAKIYKSHIISNKWAKLLLMCNVVNFNNNFGNDFLRRVIFIKFDKTFNEKDGNRFYATDFALFLKNNNAMLMTWLIEGAKIFLERLKNKEKNVLLHSDAVIKFNEETIQNNGDSVVMFLKEINDVEYNLEKNGGQYSPIHHHYIYKEKTPQLIRRFAFKGIVAPDAGTFANPDNGVVLVLVQDLYLCYKKYVEENFNNRAKNKRDFMSSMRRKGFIFKDSGLYCGKVLVQAILTDINGDVIEKKAVVTAPVDFTNNTFEDVPF